MKMGMLWGILLVAGCLLLPASPSVVENALLLRVDKTETVDLQRIDAAGAAVLQELESCFLVSSRPSALPGLGRAGIAYKVIVQPDDRASFYLLHYPQAAGPDGIGAYPLEEHIWLIWSSDRDFRNRLSQPYHLKALSLSRPLRIPETARTDRQAAKRIQIRTGPLIPELLTQVSKQRVRSDIVALQNFKTRYASTAQCEEAGEFLLNRFRSLGLDAKAETFSFESRYRSRNIVALIPGTTGSTQTILACAHYDSYSDSMDTDAPGADDNASGTAAVLEIARILAKRKFKNPVVLLCVSAEEWGLYGSGNYARQARDHNRTITAVINLDMIAYNHAGAGELSLIVNGKSQWLADRFIAVAQPLVNVNLVKTVDASLTWSDHSSFWDQGYSALCGIETDDNPYYHQTSDTVDTLDLDYATDVVKASLAVLVDLAQSVAEPEVPTGLQGRCQVSAAVFYRMKTVYLNWQANQRPVLGYNVYRSTRQSGPYVRVNESLLEQTAFVDRFLAADQHYYYVLTALDETGEESGYSVEVRDDENNG